MKSKLRDPRFWLTLLVLGISGLWSGWGTYKTYNGLEPDLARITFVLLPLIGLILTVFCEVVEKRNLALGVFVIWLSISPVYNAITLTGRFAVEAQMKEALDTLTNVADECVQLERIKEEIAMKVAEIRNFLEEQRQRQASKKLGGVGYIVRQLDKEIVLLNRIVGRLSKEFEDSETESSYLDEAFSRPNPIQRLKRKIDKLYKFYLYRTSSSSKNIFSKKYANDINTLIGDFSRDAQDAFSIAEELLNKPVPLVELELAINSLKKLRNTMDAYLRSLKSLPRDDIKVVATEDFLEWINPAIKDLELYYNEKKSIISSYDNLRKSLKIAKNKIENIRNSPTLMFRYFSNYWNAIILAYLIDLIAFALLIDQKFPSKGSPMPRSGSTGTINITEQKDEDKKIIDIKLKK